MSLPCYRPPIRRVQEEYRVEMERRNGLRPPAAAIPDYSDPSDADARTVYDLWKISERIHTKLGDQLAVATPEEAAAIFARYVDHVVCERALANPSLAVQAQARALLAELAESGDWFARDVLTRGES